MSIFKKSVNIPAVTAASIGVYGAGVPVGRLVLNGPIVSPNGTVSFIDKGYASSVTIRSAGNVSNINFTIVGTGINGVSITEVIVGANANSVFTNNLFETVLNITINNAPPGGTGFTIGSGFNVAVMLSNSITSISKLNFKSEYNVMLNSLTANADWVANSVMIYGVNGNAPISLQVNRLTYATRNNIYYALNDVSEAIERVAINNGIIQQTTYPFGAIVVAILNGVNTTPSFVEITQS